MSGLVNGITGVVKANGITVVAGRGAFKDAHTIAVEGQEDITFNSAVIATGSHALRPPVDGIDGPLCVDSTSLLEITEVPRRLLVLGGGVIGVEFASIMQHWGVEVTIVEMLDRLIPAEDADASKELARAFKKRGITMHLDTRATAVVEGKNGVTVTFQDADAKGGEVKADLVLVATGRGPSVHNIGLESAGVSFDPRTGVDVDAHMRTTVPHIYAVGDVAGKFQLAHTSFREGEIAAENALGHDATIDYAAVPRCTYTDPEVAAVGLTEAQARELHGDDRQDREVPVLGVGSSADDRRDGRLGEDHPRGPLRRAAGDRDRRPAGHRADQRGRGGDHRRGHDRDAGRLVRRAPDAGRGSQGGGTGGTGPADPPAAAQAQGRGNRGVALT